MSTCISSRGEFGSHTLDADYGCTRCGVLDEDALIAELNTLRQRVGDSRSMPIFVIKGKDALAVEAVEAYRNLCTRYGLHGQASKVQLAINEVELWQQDHEDEMRLPSHIHVPATKETTDHA